MKHASISKTSDSKKSIASANDNDSVENFNVAVNVAVLPSREHFTASDSSAEDRCLVSELQRDGCCRRTCSDGNMTTAAHRATATKCGVTARLPSRDDVIDGDDDCFECHPTAQKQWTSLDGIISRPMTVHVDSSPSRRLDDDRQVIYSGSRDLTSDQDEIHVKSSPELGQYANGERSPSFSCSGTRLFDLMRHYELNRLTLTATKRVGNGSGDDSADDDIIKVDVEQPVKTGSMSGEVSWSNSFPRSLRGQRATIGHESEGAFRPYDDCQRPITDKVPLVSVTSVSSRLLPVDGGRRLNIGDVFVEVSCAFII